MLYFIYGKDTYRSKTKLKELMEKYQPDFELQRIDGEKMKLDEFINKINAVSLLSPKRCLVFENLSLSKSQKEITQFLNEREKKLTSPQPSPSKREEEWNDIIIFYEEKVDKKTSIYKFLKKSAENFEFEELKPFELKKWVQDFIKNKNGPARNATHSVAGGRIDPVALEELFMGNTDLWFLASELEKLLAYNKHITLENVQLLTPANFDDNIFNLSDAVGKGDKSTALELINKQLESGTQPIYLLSMIIRQFRILIQIKDATQKQNYPNYSLIAKELGLHPFVVQKSISQAQKYSFEALEKIYKKLLDIDLKLKSSKIPAEVLFTKLVMSNV